eukprot:6214826-Pleurochrysis_carterae.AAC.3
MLEIKQKESSHSVAARLAVGRESSHQEGCLHPAQPIDDGRAIPNAMCGQRSLPLFSMAISSR